MGLTRINEDRVELGYLDRQGPVNFPNPWPHYRHTQMDIPSEHWNSMGLGGWCGDRGWQRSAPGSEPHRERPGVNELKEYVKKHLFSSGQLVSDHQTSLRVKLSVRSTAPSFHRKLFLYLEINGGTGHSE